MSANIVTSQFLRRYILKLKLFIVNGKEKFPLTVKSTLLVSSPASLRSSQCEESVEDCQLPAVHEPTHLIYFVQQALHKKLGKQRTPKRDTHERLYVQRYKFNICKYIVLFYKIEQRIGYIHLEIMKLHSCGLFLLLTLLSLMGFSYLCNGKLNCYCNVLNK